MWSNFKETSKLVNSVPSQKPSQDKMKHLGGPVIQLVGKIKEKQASHPLIYPEGIAVQVKNPIQEKNKHPIHWSILEVRLVNI